MKAEVSCSVLTLVLGLAVLILSAAPQAGGQQMTAVVPTLVKFSGTLTDLNGHPLSGITGVTFLLYKYEQGGAPLWMETQNVTPDKNGHYSVMLGSTRSEGLPTDLFASGEARWLGVQAQGQAEQPRVLLLSVPYALKAGDAQTLGGLPASAFVLAAPPNNAAPAAATENAAVSTASSASPLTSSNVTTTGGTANTIPLFTTGTNVQNSILTQTGTTTVNVGGKLNLPASGAATSSGGKTSRPETFVASAYNSGTKTAVAQTFQLQAEAAGNNTSTTSGTLNLLYASGTATPAETGFRINNKGQITFATGQAFPGVAELNAANTFTGNQNFTGNLSISGNEAVHGNVTGSQLISVVAAGFPPLKVTSATQVPNLNASFLGGLAPNAFAQLGVLNSFSQTLFAPQLTSTGSAEVDNGGSNVGNYVPGLQFGPVNSGETIASAQASGSPNYQGLDFYTNYVPRLQITNYGSFLLNGPIASYNGTPTYANGVPAIVLQFQNSSSGSGSPYSNLYTPTNDGVFRVTLFQECTATSGGGTIFAPSFIWTLPTGGSAGYGDIGGPDCSGLNQFTETFVAHVKGGTSIQWEYPGMNAPFQNLVLIEQLL